MAVAGDNTAFTVTYSDYLAQVGPSSDPTDIRKNCQLNLGVHIPRGSPTPSHRSTTAATERLQKGAKGTEKASYYFQGGRNGIAHP